MRKRMLLVVTVCLGLACLVMGGCGSGTERLKAFLQERRTPVSGVPYRVLPPDTLVVRSASVPEINGIQQQIRPDGRINLPLVGEIDVVGDRAEGLTARQIEARIEKAAEDYYEQVDATVQVVGYNSQKIYVFGQARSPGPQPWTGTNTVLDILARSQPTDMAWPERILVVGGAGRAGAGICWT